MISKNALHPGEFLKFYLEELGVTQSALAQRIDCTYAKVNEVCNGKRGISADFALQLGEAFNTTPLLWVNAQKAWELSEALKASSKRKKIKAFVSANETNLA